jgi:hypothetical protein
VGGAGVEPQLGEEDINSMTIEELREFINKGVAPTSLQSGESNTDLVSFLEKSNCRAQRYFRYFSCFRFRWTII